MRSFDRSVLHLLWLATAIGTLAPSAADPDLWGHLLFGSILLDGTLPVINGFSYTAAAHPWLNHELIAEATMASAYRALGAGGLVALKVALGLATLALVWRTARRKSRRAWAAAVATALAAVAMAPGFMIRPQLFTLLFLALLLDVLARSGYRARAAAWSLPPLVVLWVNTHGGVLAGVGLAAIGLATGAVDATRRGRRTNAAREVARASALVALLLIALLLNPYGAHLVVFLLTGVTPRVPITEWAPVALGDASFPLFKAMIMATVASVSLSLCTGGRHGRARPPEIAIAVVAGVAALLHRRHIPLFAIAAAPLLATAMADVARWLRRRDLRALSPVIRPALALAVIVQLALAATTVARTRARIDVDPNVYPVQALRFLAQNHIGGRVAVPFDWGEFALWALPAGSSVAVDGRFTTAYPQEILDQSWRFMSGAPGWDDLLTRHPTDVVVSSRRHPPARLLRDRADWEYIYSDPVAVVFVHRGAAQAQILDRLRAGTLVYDRTPLTRDFPALARTAAGSAIDPTLPHVAAARLAPDTGIPRASTSSGTVPPVWTGS